MGDSAFLEIEKGNYVSRVWTFHGPGASFDVLMTLTRRLPDGDWLLQYRFRHYRDDQAFDSQDEKSYWKATLPASLTEAELLRKVSPIVQALSTKTRLEMHVARIESDEPLAVVTALRTLPGMHLKFEKQPS